jgi:vancomycin permeability regulator SanA
MSNPLFSMMQNQAPMNGIMQRFQQFQRMFQGDPKQQVQQLLNSGKVSQAQYNQAVNMANQLQRMIGGK